MRIVKGKLLLKAPNTVEASDLLDERNLVVAAVECLEFSVNSHPIKAHLERP